MSADRGGLPEGRSLDTMRAARMSVAGLTGDLASFNDVLERALNEPEGAVRLICALAAQSAVLSMRVAPQDPASYFLHVISRAIDDGAVEPAVGGES